MTLEQIAAFVREFGLPIVMFALFAWAILRRKLVTAGELADKQNELDGWKALYERERTDRMAAELTTAKGAAANAEVAEAVRDVLTKVVLNDPYTERLEGRRGR